MRGVGGNTVGRKRDYTAESTQTVRVDMNRAFKSWSNFVNCQEDQVDSQQPEQFSTISTGLDSMVWKRAKQPTTTFGAFKHKGCRAEVGVQFFNERSISH